MTSIIPTANAALLASMKNGEKKILTDLNLLQEIVLGQLSKAVETGDTSTTITLGGEYPKKAGDELVDILSGLGYNVSIAYRSNREGITQMGMTNHVDGRFNVIMLDWSGSTPTDR